MMGIYLYLYIYIKQQKQNIGICLYFKFGEMYRGFQAEYPSSKPVLLVGYLTRKPVILDGYSAWKPTYINKLNELN